MIPADTDFLQELNSITALELPEQLSFENLQLLLAAHINQLIKNNFEQLISLLYKIDVSEKKLKQQLTSHPDEDAGQLIATLIIERLQQKIEFKKQFRQKPSATDNEEKW